MEPLKKDPMGMGLDVPISKYRWLTKLTDEELQTLYDLMNRAKDRASKSQDVEDELETMNQDWQELYEALEAVMRSRGLL